MKFDVVVGNPPYQDKTGNENSSNSKALYQKFIVKAMSLTSQYLAFVIPAVWASNKKSSFKDIMFKTHPPIFFKYLDKEIFNVGVPICYVICDLKSKNHLTSVVDNYNNLIEINLKNIEYIPTNLKAIKVLKKLQNTNNLAKRWIRGSLSRSEIESMPEGKKYQVVYGVNGKNKISTKLIDLKNGIVGFGKNKVIMPNTLGSATLGEIKIIGPESGISFSVVGLVCDDNETQGIKNFLNSKLVKFIVKSCKFTGPNSKSLFMNIPEIDFSRGWSDEELYKHFNLTQEEIDYIENNVK